MGQLGVFLIAEDYEDMNKKELLRTITEYEKVCVGEFNNIMFQFWSSFYYS